MNERRQPQEGIVYGEMRSQIVERITSLLKGGRQRYEVPLETVQQIQSSISEISSWPLPPIKRLELRPKEERMLTRKVTVGFIPPRIKVENGSLIEKGLLIRAIFYDNEEIARELRGDKVNGPNEQILDIMFSPEGFNPRFALTLYRKKGRREEGKTRKARFQDLEFVKKLLDTAQPV